jgi:hypothetical protein
MRSGLPHLSDLALVSNDVAYCLELHWRHGEFLSTTHRSEIAQYVLENSSQLCPRP